MKTALITSLGARSTIENYGAVIQIAAFCRILSERYGIETSVLDYIGNNCKECSNSIFFWEFFYGRGIKGRIKSVLLGNSLKKRIKSNMSFLKTNCSVTKLYNSSTIVNEEFSYDYYIAVSDVIWDSTFRNQGFDDVFFLDCEAFKRGKHIVYSAGVGDANFTDDYKKLFVKKIKNIDFWSVRERYAVDYIHNLTNSPVNVTLDPTLVVDDSFYKRFISSKRPIKNKYILIYNVVYSDPIMLRDASEYASVNGCQIVYISRTHMIRDRVATKINISVTDFLTLLFYCEALFCNSFHGICLSVKLKKEFFVYGRPNRKKIPDICNRLGIQDRIIDSNKKRNIFDEIINYDDIYIKLGEEIETSLSFLDKIFYV